MNSILKKLIIVLIFATVLAGSLGLATPPTASADKPPIPVGCKGSKLPGPPSPADLKVCDKIPAGCPGSPKAGPKKPASKCPYSATAKAKPITYTKGATVPTNDTCGSGSDAVKISINIGCKGQGNPIADMLFAVIRVLSDGVGLIVIGSIVLGGIQYSASRGDPQATAMAVNRIRSSLIALLIYIFGYAILNYIIPKGFLG